MSDEAISLSSFLIFGTGAVGTYVGGSLVLSGAQVVFMERPDVATDMRKSGLHLRLDEVEHSIPKPLVFGSLEEALAHGPYDAAIFALKSYDTEKALVGLEMIVRRAKYPPPAFLCLQNGVENELALASALGAERVIAGTLTSAIGRRGLGDVVLEKKRGLGVAAGHPLSAALVKALNSAKLNARLYPNAASMKWSKLLTNLLGNATSAILDMPPREVFAHPGLYQLEIAQLREALEVMAAMSVKPTNLPRTPVLALAFAARYLPTQVSRPFIARAAGGGRGGKMPSFHIDLHSGRGVSEVDYLNGAVVRYGERLGVPTPVNRLLNQTLLKLVTGVAPLAAYARKPEELLKKCREARAQG
jgi:2-dehydropantoate 2-reductase